MPLFLVVFHDELAAIHLVQMSAREMDFARIVMPLLVSFANHLERMGAVGAA